MKTNEQLLDRLATDLLLAGKAERTAEAHTGAVRQFLKISGKSRPSSVNTQFSLISQEAFPGWFNTR